MPATFPFHGASASRVAKTTSDAVDMWKAVKGMGEEAKKGIKKLIGD